MQQEGEYIYLQMLILNTNAKKELPFSMKISLILKEVASCLGMTLVEGSHE